MPSVKKTAKSASALLIVLASAITVAQSNPPSQQKQIAPGRTIGIAAGAPLDPFPGGVGSYWIYEGVVRSQGAGNKVEEKKVRSRMSLARTLRREGATAVILTGFPGDVDWFHADWSSNPPAKESMFVRTDDGGIYLLEWETGNPEQEFADSHIPLPQLLDQADLLLRWPPIVGAQPGGGNCPDRSDDMYCWVLHPTSRVSLRKIKGVKPGSYVAYSLAYITNPDSQSIDIVPGVGVTAYDYSHHGTVGDVELHLVEAHLVEAK